ncbi:MAG: hypothetical protein AAGI17_04440 [Planctomycetota bacterium]
MDAETTGQSQDAADQTGRQAEAAARTPARTPASAPAPTVSALRKRRGLYAWLIASPIAIALLWSLVAHLVGLVATYFITFGSPRMADGDGDGGEVEFAYMTDVELQEVLDVKFADDAPEIAETVDTVPVEIQSDPLVEVGDLLEAASVGFEVSSGGGDVGQGLESLSGASTGDVSFFGVEAQGSRFAYVVDVSRSMLDQDKWSTTARELERSVFSLPEQAEFIVILYSDSAGFLTPRGEWQPAGDTQKRAARARLRSVAPNGGTQPLGAFEDIFRMRDKPDAVYFMTDGLFAPSPNVPSSIARLNRRYRVAINTILFGDLGGSAAAVRTAKEDMQQIARQSGGQFIHVQNSRGGRP